MATFKLVIGTKEGKCVQKELQEPQSKELVGRKLGEKITGDSIGFHGFEFEITGGSDHCGFPMRKDVPGTGRKRILAVEGVGIHRRARGIRVRKTVCGNTIHPKIVQVNLKVLKEGREPLIAPEAAKAEASQPKTEEPAKAEAAA